MRLVERFHLALGSQLGVVFVGLLFVLALLAVVYWFLVVRQKRKDLLAFLHRSYYERAATTAKDLRFFGAHKADFFGRQTVVQFSTGAFGLCLIPPPNWVSQGVKDRFRCFHYAKEHLAIPLLAPSLWVCHDPVLALVEGGVVDARGRLLPNLKHHLLDAKWALTSREQILFELARSLSKLHEQQAEVGGRLYHGFLLPRSLFLEMDAEHHVVRLVVAQAGMTFAMGSERFYEQLLQLKEGRLPIEKYCANEILEQLPMLAPEQKDAKRLKEVGPASDFFAYGALAIALLTRQRFVSVEKVDWKRVPERWLPFLQACLAEVPAERPHDFMELEDWLNDPELALTYTHSTRDKTSEVSADVCNGNLLTDILRRAHVGGGNRPTKQSIEAKITSDLDRHLAEGLKAIKAEKWQAAKVSLQKVVKMEADHSLAHVNLAIACYELGDHRQAEKHYEKAKNANPRTAKGFRQHLAFRL